MSTQSVETVLSRAMSDAVFADLLFSSPDQALAGYDLSTDEIASFKALSRVDFDKVNGAGPEERRSFFSFMTAQGGGG